MSARAAAAPCASVTRYPAGSRIRRARVRMPGSSSTTSTMPWVFAIVGPILCSRRLPSACHRVFLAMWLGRGALAPRRRLVGDGPEGADMFHGVDERVKLHRLDYVGIDTKLIAVE